VFCREQEIGPLKNGSKLFEDEDIERISADVALGATSMLTAGTQRIVIMAVVIRVPGRFV